MIRQNQLVRSYTLGRSFRRCYKVLAIETSCDDSCVALLDRPSRTEAPVLLDHFKSTLNSTESGGIIPTKAFVHHQQSLSELVNQMCHQHGLHQSPPDLICVTRGPGMPGSLNIGCDTAKGLSVAWNKPLIGVHHMLAHLLVPRMASNGSRPSFPFWSLLVSGGHTMLVHSTELTKHEVVCDTIDIAVGDALDKCARKLGFKGNMIAKEMAHFIEAYNNDVSINKDVDLTWINAPLQNKPGRKNVQAFSFSSLNGMVERTLQKHQLKEDSIPLDIKYTIARHIQQTVFQHLVDKTKLSLSKSDKSALGGRDFVISGGVSANNALRHIFESSLPEFDFHYPEISLCTDNAVMIGWAGIELFETYGYVSDLQFTPLRKWPLTEDVLGSSTIGSVS